MDKNSFWKTVFDFSQISQLRPAVKCLTCGICGIKREQSGTIGVKSVYLFLQCSLSFPGFSQGRDNPSWKCLSSPWGCVNLYSREGSNSRIYWALEGWGTTVLAAEAARVNPLGRSDPSVPEAPGPSSVQLSWHHAQGETWVAFSSQQPNCTSWNGTVQIHLHHVMKAHNYCCLLLSAPNPICLPCFCLKRMLGRN